MCSDPRDHNVNDVCVILHSASAKFNVNVILKVKVKAKIKLIVTLAKLSIRFSKQPFSVQARFP